MRSKNRQQDTVYRFLSLIAAFICSLSLQSRALDCLSQPCNPSELFQQLSSATETQRDTIEAAWVERLFSGEVPPEYMHEINNWVSPRDGHEVPQEIRLSAVRIFYRLLSRVGNVDVKAPVVRWLSAQWQHESDKVLQTMLAAVLAEGRKDDTILRAQSMKLESPERVRNAMQAIALCEYGIGKLSP